MIYVVFISLCIAWYFYHYFENKRTDQRDEQIKKRRSAFEQLLKLLHEKEQQIKKNANTQSTE